MPSHRLMRTAAGLFGGWLFTWGFVALGITLQVAAGQPFDEARKLLHMLAFLVFLGVLLWAHGAARMCTVWTTLVGGGALMALAAWRMSGSLA